MSYIITQTADELPTAQFLIAYGPDGPRWTDLRANARQYDTKEAAELVLNKLKQLPDAEAVTLDTEPYEQTEQTEITQESVEKQDTRWKRWKQNENQCNGYIMCVLEEEKRIGYIDLNGDKKVHELHGTVEEKVTQFYLKLRDRSLNGIMKRWFKNE